MDLRRTLVAVVVAIVMALAFTQSASGNPYNERCGDGTPHGCVTHCIKFHGGVDNLHNCLWAHWLV